MYANHDFFSNVRLEFINNERAEQLKENRGRTYVGKEENKTLYEIIQPEEKISILWIESFMHKYFGNGQLN